MPSRACGYRNRSPVEAELLRVEQIHQLADVVLHNCAYANRAVVRKFHKSLRLLIQPDQDVNLYTLAKPDLRVVRLQQCAKTTEAQSDCRVSNRYCNNYLQYIVHSTCCGLTQLTCRCVTCVAIITSSTQYVLLSIGICCVV